MSAIALLNIAPSKSLVKYKVTPDGEIQTINPPARNGGSRDRRLGYQASPPEVDDYLKRVADYPYGSLEEAQAASAEVKLDKKLGAFYLSKSAPLPATNLVAELLVLLVLRVQPSTKPYHNSPLGVTTDRLTLAQC
ncbi:MAG: hypothetical protein EBS53_19515 [Bacteroidetes bacterium]|nr:hypothetical protein [Bacteroidota bacterium]